MRVAASEKLGTVLVLSERSAEKEERGQNRRQYKAQNGEEIMRLESKNILYSQRNHDKSPEVRPLHGTGDGRV